MVRYRPGNFVLSIGVTLGLLLVLQPKAAEAATTSIKLQINGITCTVDEIYTGSVPEYIINPEECTKPPISTSIQESGGARAVFAAANVDEQPGAQSIFENTRLEPLAFSVGIGNSKVSSAQPIGIATLFISGTLLLIDLAFFNFQFTQNAFSMVRRRG